jgi:hypothetical protein
MLDILLLIILGIVTWCVAGEGVWGGALVLLSVLFSGFIAMNFFEPLAESLSSGGSFDFSWDFLCLVGIFAACVTGFRFATLYLMPVYVEVLPLMYDVGRWVLGLAAGYVTMAFLATAMHTAPLPREFLNFTPEKGMLFGINPDRQWLGLTQYVTERIYKSGRVFDGERYPQVPEEARRETNPDLRRERLATWSSFPMRYAARRAQGGGAAPAAPAAPVVPATPTPGGTAPAPDF